MEEVPRSKWEHLNLGIPEADAFRVFKSDRFLVQIRRHNYAVLLCVCKCKFKKFGQGIEYADGITWDELQEIKNQCGYENSWLCEYYPPKDKLINVANIRHLWVMDKDPENKLNDKIPGITI